MINIFKTIDIYRKFAGAPQEMVYSTDEAERRKKADEKAKQEAMAAMQQQQEAQGAVQLTQAYKNISEAER